MSAHDQKSASLPVTSIPAPAGEAAARPASAPREAAGKPAATPAPARPRPQGPGQAPGQAPAKKPPAKKLDPKIQERIEAALQKPVLPPAGLAQAKPRHYGLAVSFVLVVILPLLVSAFYLYTRAADQYASYVGFSVRSESAAPSTADVLGGLGSLVGASSTSDTDVLYKFIQSRDLVERVDSRLDLREIWSKAPNDPIFGFRGDDSLEDLVAEWKRKVRIHYDTGMIDLRILAFDPHDAQNIAAAILDEGGIVINDLNAIAREDALRYSRDELERAQDRLREARQAVTEFRNRYQLVDPAADVQSQTGVVTSLQQQLAEQLVSLGLLQANAQPDDPRISQTELRISIIRDQIEAERQKFASNGEQVALSDVVGQYETLAMDRQFAETSYTAALASYETARAEAVRQSRYLAPYIRPTLAQEAEFPQRAQLLAMTAGFLVLLWIIGSLMFYSLRDRR